VEFEPTVPASERAKTVHALDRSATVTGHTDKYGHIRQLRGNVQVIGSIGYLQFDTAVCMYTQYATVFSAVYIN
jgi:hypothetical protein